MYLVDYHVHTKRCGHAYGEDREYIEEAIKLGLREIGFSDHVPRFYGPKDPKAEVTERGMSPTDLEGYVQAILEYKREYRGEIAVKLGLEVDFVPGLEYEVERVGRSYPWDYFIGSIHFIPEWNYGYIGREKDHGPEEIFPEYFNKVAEAAESGLYDFLGHIDLPKLTFPRLEPGVMRELHQQFARRLGKVGGAIEINTQGIRGSKDWEAGVYPDEQLLRLLRDQGVKVTLGSDAHTPQNVGQDLDAALELMRTVGYTEIAVYDQRAVKMVRWE